LAPLLWHQDNFPDRKAYFDHLGFVIVDQKGLNPHFLELGHAPRDCLKLTQEHCAMTVPNDCAKMVERLVSECGAGYLINQKWNDEQNLCVVHRRTDVATFVTTEMPSLQWEWKGSNRDFFSDVMPNYMKCKTNNILDPSFVPPRRRKIIFRFQTLSSSNI
jgi:hypothetical protein